MKSLNEIIRELSAIEAESVLLEGQDYNSMFKSLFDHVRKLAKENAKDEEDKNKIQELDKKLQEFEKIAGEKINFARTNLKKNDRVVWYLKIIRLFMIHSLIFQESSLFLNTNDLNKNLVGLQNKELAGFSNPQSTLHFVGNYYSPIRHWANNLDIPLQHYFSLPIADIQNVVLLKQSPENILETFHDIEKEWNEKQVQVTTQEEHHEVVLKFPDGKAWFNLNQEYCEKEGKAMGHCGNKASYDSGDTILSLREPVKGKTTTEWRPLLTFILHDTGFLGEMKGRGNAKPAAQYHNYIIELLKLPIIEGISGGGYAPERNFSLKDLPENEQKDLYEVKPVLAPLTYQYEKNGFNAFLWKRALTKLEDQIPDLAGKTNPVKFDNKDKSVILEQFKNLKEFLEHCGTYSGAGRKDNTVSYVMDYYNGDNTVDYSPEVNFSEIKDFINDLPDEYKTALESYVKNKYKTETEDADDIAQTLEENSDETFDLIRSSLIDGYRAGYETDMFNAFKKAIINWSAEGMHLKFQYSGDHPHFDEPVELVMAADDFFNVLDDGKGELLFYEGTWVPRDEAPYLDEPRYGWSGYEKETAMERFKSELSSDVEKFMPKKKIKKTKK